MRRYYGLDFPLFSLYFRVKEPTGVEFIDENGGGAGVRQHKRQRLPARRRALEFLISEIKDIMPDATWAAAGIGRHQLEVNR